MTSQEAGRENRVRSLLEQVSGVKGLEGSVLLSSRRPPRPSAKQSQGGGESRTLITIDLVGASQGVRLGLLPDS